MKTAPAPRRARRALLTLCAVLLISSAAIPPAQADEKRVEVFDACLHHIKANFHDRARFDEAWEERFAAFRERAVQASDDGELRQVLRELLASPSSSHTRASHRAGASTSARSSRRVESGTPSRCSTARLAMNASRTASRCARSYRSRERS